MQKMEWRWVTEHLWARMSVSCDVLGVLALAPGLTGVSLRLQRYAGRPFGLLIPVSWHGGRRHDGAAPNQLYLLPAIISASLGSCPRLTFPATRTTTCAVATPWLNHAAAI
jgi:hypothetical protein